MLTNELTLDRYHEILAWLDGDETRRQHASLIVRTFNITFSEAHKIWIDYRRMRNIKEGEF